MGRKRSREDTIILQTSINDTTVRLTPAAPIKEVGNILWTHQGAWECKMDLADGYWRMVVKPEVRWNFAYIMLLAPDTPIWLVIPSMLQMGWNKSPAYFCATTETAQYVAQSWIDGKKCLSKHPMESFTTPMMPAKHQSTNGL
jgi:hypothetical protein